MPAADFFRRVRQTLSRGGVSFARKGSACIFPYFLALSLLLVLMAPQTGAASADAPAFSSSALLLAAADGEQGTPGPDADERQRPEAASMPGQLLQGSFLGAILFGYPYEGVGTADIAVIAVLALLALRVFAGRGKQSGRDKFTVQRRENSTSLPEDRLAWPERDENRPPQAGRPDAPRTGNEAGPHDNAWSGRLGSGNGQPPARDGQSWDWNRAAGGNRNADASPGNGPQPPEQKQPPFTMKDQAARMWNYYSGNQSESDAGQEAKTAPGLNVPAGFDVADFLEGARTLYIRLQKAWAARKVDELQPFVSPQLLDLLKSQATRDPYPVQVDILLVDAELRDIRQTGGREEATVSFAVSMRSGNETRPQDIHELWRFVRGTESGGMWRLEGIEQP